MSIENPKQKSCQFAPQGQGESCRRAGCKDFNNCPAGEVVLKKGEKVIVAKPDSLLDKSEKFSG